MPCAGCPERALPISRTLEPKKDLWLPETVAGALLFSIIDTAGEVMAVQLEERAGIVEFDGQLPRSEAEAIAWAPYLGTLKTGRTP